MLARRHGLAGKNEWEEAQIDAYVAQIYDTFESKHQLCNQIRLIICKFITISEATPIYRAGDDLGKMKGAVNDFTKTEAEPLLQRLEQRLIDNGTGFLIGDKVYTVQHHHNF